MMVTVCPCKDCERRTPDCHGKCNDYLEWASENSKIREVKNEKKRVDFLSKHDKPVRRKKR